MRSKILGSILLIIAMSIGAGLLSLPVATAAGGFINGTVLMVLVWLVMTMGGLFILEVSLWLPQDSNLVSMAKHTLGLGGKIAVWICYLVLLYMNLCVYMSGGTDTLHSLWSLWHWSLPSWLNTSLFLFVFGIFVWHGIRWVDHTNRVLMSAKMLAFFLLVFLLFPVMHHTSMPAGEFKALNTAILPVVFSFGYAVIIPTLRSYLDSDIRKLQLVIIIGSIIPLICYILWNYVVLGIMPQAQLIAIDHQGQVVSQLNAGLSAIGSPWITTLIHVFTAFCVLTAFLAVSLSLSDFIADGISVKKEGKSKWLVYGLTFLPPLIVVLFQPYIYMTAIRYAGILCVVILMLIPTLMVLVGRYKHKTYALQAPYKAPGGLFTVLVMSVISVILLIFTLFVTFG